MINYLEKANQELPMPSSCLICSYSYTSWSTRAACSPLSNDECNQWGQWTYKKKMNKYHYNQQNKPTQSWQINYFLSSLFTTLNRRWIYMYSGSKDRMDGIGDLRTLPLKVDNICTGRIQTWDWWRLQCIAQVHAVTPTYQWTAVPFTWRWCTEMKWS